MISDIHDHLDHLESALKAARGAQVLLCCGDLCSPFVVDRLGRGFQGDIHVVFGNNDGDRYRIALRAAGFRNITLHGEFAELDIDGRKIALHHFDDVGRALARGGKYDLVCFGHNHRAETQSLDGTVLLNPGEVMGGLSPGKSPSLGFYDTQSGVAELCYLKTESE